MPLGHSRSSKYYTLVLRAEKPGDVQRSASDAVYSRLLAESRAQSAIPLVRRERDGMVGSDDDGDALLSSGDDPGDDVADGHPPHPRGDSDGLIGSEDDAIPAEALLDVGSDEDGRPPPVPPPAAAPGSPARESRDGSNSSKSSGSSSSSSAAPTLVGSDADVGGDGEPREDVVVQGVKLRFDFHISKRVAAENYARYTVKCPRHGGGCAKKRGCGVAQQRLLGIWEPHAYLMAWRETADLFGNKKDHVRHRPTEEVIAWAHTKHFRA